MRYLTCLTICCLLLLMTAEAGLCQSGRQSGKDSSRLDTAEIIGKLESKYNNADIKAAFSQESTLEAMDITDRATGRVWFKHPGMMRWEYETPDEHAIITDGDTLWIHRPADNQVVVGDALAYFGNGKGASFLSNIELIKEEFAVEKLSSQKPGFYTLKLTPREKTLDLKQILLHIEEESSLIRHVVTENAYEDKTRITFENIEFPESIPSEKFQFDIPPGADVMEMAQ